MNVSLPDELKRYAEAQTKFGYSTPSEYVRELIRADKRRRAKEKLDATLVEGLRSGDSIPIDDKFWDDLKQDVVTRLSALKKSSEK